MKKEVLIILCLFFAVSINGQNYNTNIWYFGYRCGLDFNSATPVVLTNGKVNTHEGCATVCDSEGNLLFYSDGISVWDSTHSYMPHGTVLLGGNSTTNSCIIVPKPNNDSLFYIFTLDYAENNLIYGLRYSIVNMNLNGGKGDVDPTKKNKLIYAKSCEKMQAVSHANGTYFWLVTHEWGTNAFKTFLIDSDSLHTTPVISNIGATPSYVDNCMQSMGFMKATISGSKIALAHYSLGAIELFDFDNSTGILSNCQTDVTCHPDAYGLEFSPDETKMYVCDIINPNLYQYDISGGSFSDPINISNSLVNGGGLQLGPDGKIYVSDVYTSYLDVINNPNGLGEDCDYVNDAIYLESRTCGLGMPNLLLYKDFTL